MNDKCLCGTSILDSYHIVLCDNCLNIMVEKMNKNDYKLTEEDFKSLKMKANSNG